MDFFAGMEVHSNPNIPPEPQGYKMPDLPWASQKFKDEYRSFLCDFFGAEYPVYVVDAGALGFSAGGRIIITHPQNVAVIKTHIS